MYAYAVTGAAGARAGRSIASLTRCAIGGTGRITGSGVDHDSRVGGQFEEVSHGPSDGRLVQRANTAVLLSILWGALAACAIGATIYDIAYWVGAW